MQKWIFFLEVIPAVGHCPKGRRQYDDHAGLAQAVGRVPPGEMMLLQVARDYDCSGHYCDDGICQDTTAEELLESLFSVGLFEDATRLLEVANEYA